MWPLDSVWFWIIVVPVSIAYCSWLSRQNPLMRLSRAEINSLLDEHGRLPIVMHPTDPRIKLQATILAKGEFDGSLYECKRCPATGPSGACLVLTLFQRCGGQFLLVRGAPRVWYRRLELFGYVGTGNACIDSGFNLIASAADESTKRILKCPSFCDAVNDLALLRVDSIRKDEIAIDAVWADSPTGEVLQSSSLEQYLVMLSRLGREFSELPTARFRLVDAVWLLVGFCFPVVFCICALTLIRLCQDRYELIASEYPRFAMIIAPISALFAVAVDMLHNRILRPRSDSRAYRYCLLSITFLAGLLTGMILSVWANGALDRAPALKHVQPVESFAASETNGRCRVDVSSWRDADESERVFISREECEHLESIIEDLDIWPYLEITTKPGFLGFEWIVSARVASPELE